MKKYIIILVTLASGMMTSLGVVLSGNGGLNMGGAGNIYNLPTLLPADQAVSFTNIPGYVVNVGQLIGLQGDGTLITNPGNLLPFVGQSVEVVNASGDSIVAITDQGITLWDEGAAAFVPLVVTNGTLLVDGNTDSTLSAANQEKLDEIETGTPAIGTVLAGQVNGTLMNVTLQGQATIAADGTVTIGGLTVSSMAPASIVLEAEGIAANDNDTTLPTSAAVKDYVDANGGSLSTLSDTTITSPTTGHALVWTGAGWENGEIDTQHIAYRAIGSDQLALDGIGSGHINDGQVKTADILNRTILGEDIALDAIDGDHIDSNTILGGHIVTGTIRPSDFYWSPLESAGENQTYDATDGPMDTHIPVFITDNNQPAEGTGSTYPMGTLWLEADTLKLFLYIGDIGGADRWRLLADW